MKYTEAINILGVTNTATTAEVKQAYRQMAKKYHPDVNKEDINAGEKFKEINEAYQVLLNGPKDSYYSNAKTTNYSQANNYNTASTCTYDNYYTPPKQNYIFLYLSIFAIIFTVFLLILFNQIPINQVFWYIRGINSSQILIGSFFVYFIYKLGRINPAGVLYLCFISLFLFIVIQAVLTDLMCLINNVNAIFNQVNNVL